MIHAIQLQELRDVYSHTMAARGLDAALEAVAKAGSKMDLPAEPMETHAAIVSACRIFEVTTAQFFGRRRTLKKLVKCRRTAALALRMLGQSFPQIARSMGRSDHTTAMFAVERASLSADALAVATDIANVVRAQS